MLKIGIPKETIAGERRVAVTPNSVRQLLKLDFKVAAESKTGEEASFTDKLYKDTGASIVPENEAWVSRYYL